MKLGGLGTAGRDLRALLEGGSLSSLSDGELLDRFAAGRGDSRAEQAFGSLVARHGPMVWGTCRRILRDPHAAEDAFQATFLILVKKAATVRVEGSLGRWLHGVGVRVALRARADRVRTGRDLSGLEPMAARPSEIGELKAVIDEEVDRLPARYRSVVVLCHLEGLTREHAAARLRCPVGTVNSRLSRAGAILRDRLTRRGLAPVSGGLVAWLAATDASAAVPLKLLNSTVVAAGRVASGLSLAGMVPAGVAILLQGVLRRMGMMTLMKMTACGTICLGLATLGLAARGQDPLKSAQSSRPRADEPPGSTTPLAPKQPTLAQRFEAILAEWKTANEVAVTESSQGKTPAEQREIYWKFYPDESTYFDRCLALADESPRDVGARDAWLWVIREGMRNNDAVEPRASQVRRAVNGLVQHHGSDIVVIRTALNIHNVNSANRTALGRGLFARAQSHEAQGVAAVVLAQVLEREADAVEWAQSLDDQPVTNYLSYDDDGTPKIIKGTTKPYDDAYFQALKLVDAPTLRLEIKHLYERVIAEFGDVPLNPRKYQDGKIVPNPHPKSLAEHAQSRLDHLYVYTEGKPAPEIVGVDLDGRPLKLADAKGKVVVLVFWNSGCGPCLAAIPHERALLERFKDQPFAILGINTDEKPEAALKAVKDHNIPWPNWRDGHDGPIADRYQVRSFPTTLVIDSQGIIRAKNAAGDSLDESVEKLLKTLEPQPTGGK